MRTVIDERRPMWMFSINALKKDYSDQLNPFVRDKFTELWQAAQVSEDY